MPGVKPALCHLVQLSDLHFVPKCRFVPDLHILTKCRFDPTIKPMRYEILPHTADGKFRAFGETLEEAFANAALATASLMWDWAKVEPRIGHSIDVRGRDREQLLVKFLGEIVYLFDTERFMLGRVEDLRIEEASVVRDPQGETDVTDHLSEASARLRLTARFLGDALSDRSEIHGAVKAVTYNEMKIERCDCAADSSDSAGGAKGGYVVQVVVDM